MSWPGSYLVYRHGLSFSWSLRLNTKQFTAALDLGWNTEGGAISLLSPSLSYLHPGSANTSPPALLMLSPDQKPLVSLVHFRSRWIWSVSSVIGCDGDAGLLHFLRTWLFEQKQKNSSFISVTAFTLLRRSRFFRQGLGSVMCSLCFYEAG